MIFSDVTLTFGQDLILQAQNKEFFASTVVLQNLPGRSATKHAGIWTRHTK